MGHAIT